MNLFFPDGIGINAIVDFGKATADVPAQLFLLFVFKALEFFDEIEFKLYRNPGGKLKGNIFVSISASVATCLGDNSNSIGFFYPLLRC